MNAKADKSESQGAKTVPSSNSAWRRTLVFDSHVAYTELNTPSPYTLLSVYALCARHYYSHHNECWRCVSYLMLLLVSIGVLGLSALACTLMHIQSALCSDFVVSALALILQTRLNLDSMSMYIHTWIQVECNWIGSGSGLNHMAMIG